MLNNNFEYSIVPLKQLYFCNKNVYNNYKYMKGQLSDLFLRLINKNSKRQR